MIDNPRDMRELAKLRNRTRRLYGMSRITMDQHDRALMCLELFARALEGQQDDLPNVAFAVQDEAVPA